MHAGSIVDPSEVYSLLNLLLSSYVVYETMHGGFIIVDPSDVKIFSKPTLSSYVDYAWRLYSRSLRCKKLVKPVLSSYVNYAWTSRLYMRVLRWV